MVNSTQQRAAADYLLEEYDVSQRRICRVIGRSRSTVRYRRSPPADEPKLVREIKRLARRHPRYGYRMVHARLVRLVAQPSRFKNDVWTCDFIHDRTASGGPLKWLTMVDEYTRECLVLHADHSLTGPEVRRIVAGVIGRRGAPTRIRSDNGSEFICAALTNWLPRVGAEPIPVAAGRPWENGYIESFHSRLRDEFLERHEFEDVADARAKGAWHRREYNNVRPHSSLKYETPKEFSAACDKKGEMQAKLPEIVT